MAGNEDLVTAVVDPEAIAQVEKMTNALTGAYAALVDFISKAKESEQAFSITASYAQLTTNLNNSSKAQEGLTDATGDYIDKSKQLNSSLNNTGGATQRLAQEQLNLKTRIIENTQDINELSSSLKKIEGQFNSTGRSVNGTRQEIERLRQENLNLGAQLEKVSAQLKIVEDASNKVSGTFKQLTVSTDGGTGAMSKFASMFERMATRFILYQFVFEVAAKGIEYFSQKIKDSFNGLTEYEQELEKVNKAAAEFDKRKLQEKASLDREALFKNPVDESNIQDINRQLVVLKAQQETGRNALKDKQANMELDKKIFDLEQKKLDLELDEMKISQGLIDVHRNRGTAVEAEDAKQYYILADQIKDKEAEIQAARIRFSREQEDKYNPYKTPKKQHDYTGNELKTGQSDIKEQYAGYAAFLQAEAELDKKAADDYGKTLAERLAAFQSYQQREFEAKALTLSAEIDQTNLQLNKIAELEDIPRKKRTAQQQDLINTKATEQDKLLRLTEQYGKLQVKSADDTKEGLKKITQEQVEIQLDQLKKIKENNDVAREQELGDLQKKYNKGDLSPDAFKYGQEGINHKYNQKDVDDTKNYLNEVVELNKTTGADLSKVNEDIFKNTKTGVKDELDYETFIANKKIEAADDMKDKLIQLEQETVQAIQTIQDNQFAKEQQQLELQAQAAQLTAQQQIQAVNAKFGNDINKQQQLNEVNAQAQSQQNQIAAEQKEINIQQAKFDKEASIAKIIASTAEAVAKTYAAYAGIPGGIAIATGIAALEIGIGAAQLAAAESVPIPQYWKGTDYHPGGPAIVGEKGTEAIVTSKGTFLTPGKPTLIPDLEMGAKVITHEDVMRHAESSINGAYMAEAFQMQMEFDKSLSKQTDRLMEGFTNMTYEMRRQKVVIINKGGLDNNYRSKRTGH